MTFEERMNAVTLEELAARGGMKWSGERGGIGAFVAEMDFGLAPAIADALHDAVDRADFGYLPKRLVTGLQEATSDWLRDGSGWQVAPERIQALPDVIKGLEVTLEHFSRPGSKVIVPTPAYMPFLTVPGMSDREVIEVPLATDGGRYTFDLDALQAAFDAGGGLLLLCNPYNPVGRVFSREELLAVAEVVDRNGGRVFADEIWSPLIYPGATHVPYASLSETTAGHTVTALSASKAFNLPGLKCAELVLSNEADAELWAKVGFFASHGTSNLGVVANTAAFRDGRGWLDDVVAYLDGNRRLLGRLVSELLPGVRYTEPEGTYVGWLDFRQTGLEKPADFFAEQAGVVLTDGVACGQAGEGFARFIFAMPRPVLEQAVRQMGEALAAR